MSLLLLLILWCIHHCLSQVPKKDFALANYDLKLSQFGFLLADAISSEQITHLDALQTALVTIVLLSDVKLNEDGTIVSCSTAPATQFVDLSKFEDLVYKTKLEFADVNEVMKNLDEVQIWGPNVERIKCFVSSKDLVQFLSTRMHGGPGTLKKHINRLVVFAVHVRKEHVITYQKEESPIFAMEVLLEFVKHGSTPTKKRDAKQLLIDWRKEIGIEAVMFNYLEERESCNVDIPMGEEIRVIVDESDDDVEDSDDDYVLE